jgi:predicted Zn-dependent peptidase
VIARAAIALLLLGAGAPVWGGVEPPAVTAPAGATVERVTVWRQAGITSLALSNGVDVHLRPMAKPGTGRVVVAVLVPGIELDETAATRGTGMLAIDALKPAAGPGKLKVVQRPEGLLITASCAAADLEGTLRQIAATLAEPALDAEAFAQAREKALSQSAAFEGRPDHKAAEAMLRLMTPADDVRLRRPTAANIEAVTLERATASLRRHLSTSAVDVSLVGDVDAATVGPAAAEIFGALPARARNRMLELRAAKRLPPPAGEADAVVEGVRAMLTVSLPAPAISDLADARVAAVAARLLEREVAEGLRESGLKVSQASGVAMTGRTHFDLGSVIGSFLLVGDEAHVKGAAAVARERIAKLIEDGPTNVQLKRAVEDAEGEIGSRIESADYWSQSLAMAWFLRVSVDELGTAPAMIKATTAQRARQHMEKWWRPEGMLTVTIVPAAAEEGLPAGGPMPGEQPGGRP